MKSILLTAARAATLPGILTTRVVPMLKLIQLVSGYGYGQKEQLKLAKK